ncbi:MAG: hypothetical protein Q8Q79_06410, partial [Sphingopyxis sp.]|nr:hypothetical protein [Sphingopyxis sp.]
ASDACAVIGSAARQAATSARMRGELMVIILSLIGTAKAKRPDERRRGDNDSAGRAAFRIRLAICEIDQPRGSPQGQK